MIPIIYSMQCKLIHMLDLFVHTVCTVFLVFVHCMCTGVLLFGYRVCTGVLLFGYLGECFLKYVICVGLF